MAAPPAFLAVSLDADDVTLEREVLARLCPGARIEALGLTSQAAALAHPLLPLADVVFMWHTLTLDTALVSRLTRARAVVRVGVGYDNIDLAACTAAGLPVRNVPDYGTEEVADHALALILGLLRRTHASAAAAAAGDAAHGSDGVARLAAGTVRVRGVTLALLGCGRIGSAVALRGKAFGMDVVFYDPHAPSGHEKALGVRRAHSPRELAAQARVLSVHCDRNASSLRLVDGALLRAMPRGGFVVNTARGGIVVERDLRAALDDGHVAGAGIDVHEVEPYVGTDASQPLAGARNCICTPHTAFYSDESFAEMRTTAATAAAAALLGTPLTDVVNARALAASAAAGGAPARTSFVAPRD